MTETLRTKCVRDPKEAADGLRLLVTRYWPRPWTKQKVAAQPDKRLAPSEGLLHAYKKAKRMSWPQYVLEFLGEMQAPEALQALAEVGELVAAGTVVTLLCECHAGPEGESGIKCHRRLVKALVLGEDLLPEDLERP